MGDPARVPAGRLEPGPPIRAGLLAVLLVQRRDDPYQGYWALPGGFVRADESADEAARRELAEETGVSAFTGHLEQRLLSMQSPQNSGAELSATR